jgi:hypothetical protein
MFMVRTELSGMSTFMVSGISMTAEPVNPALRSGPCAPDPPSIAGEHTRRMEPATDTAQQIALSFFLCLPFISLHI